jgi:hypothetical protein
LIESIARYIGQDLRSPFNPPFALGFFLEDGDVLLLEEFLNGDVDDSLEERRSLKNDHGLNDLRNIVAVIIDKGKGVTINVRYNEEG